MRSEKSGTRTTGEVRGVRGGVKRGLEDQSTFEKDRSTVETSDGRPRVLDRTKKKDRLKTSRTSQFESSGGDTSGGTDGVHLGDP